MGLSSDEYVLLDCIWHTQASEVYGKDGWCEHSYAELADVLGLKKSGVFAMVDRLVKMGLMEVDPANPKRKKTAVKFHLMAHLAAEPDEEGVLVVQKVKGKTASVQKVNDFVQKVNGERSKSERHINIISNKENKTLSPNAETSENKNAPQWGDNSEVRLQKAQNALSEYFTQNPERWKELSNQARNQCSETDFQTEIDLWLRRNADDFTITQNPVKALTSGRGNFISWLAQTWCRQKYQQHETTTQTGRNGRVQQRGPLKTLLTFEEFQRRQRNL